MHRNFVTYFALFCLLIVVNHTNLRGQGTTTPPTPIATGPFSCSNGSFERNLDGWVLTPGCNGSCINVPEKLQCYCSQTCSNHIGGSTILNTESLPDGSERITYSEVRIYPSGACSTTPGAVGCRYDSSIVVRLRVPFSCTTSCVISEFNDCSQFVPEVYTCYTYTNISTTYIIRNEPLVSSCYNFNIIPSYNMCGFSSQNTSALDFTPCVVNDDLVRYDITEADSEFDPILGNDLPTRAPGQGRKAIRLGNRQQYASSEKLEKEFIVTPKISRFTFWYAFVLQVPPNSTPTTAHTQYDSPYFKAELLDSLGQLIEDPRPMILEANPLDPLTAPFFETKTINNNTFLYQTWTQVCMNLSAYIGMKVILRFTTADCTQGAHFGYAYIDGVCPCNCPESDPTCVCFDSIADTCPKCGTYNMINLCEDVETGTN